MFLPRIAALRETAIRIPILASGWTGRSLALALRPHVPGTYFAPCHNAASPCTSSRELGQLDRSLRRRSIADEARALVPWSDMLRQIGRLRLLLLACGVATLFLDGGSENVVGVYAANHRACFSRCS